MTCNVIILIILQEQSSNATSSTVPDPSSLSAPPLPPPDCPVDRDELGRATWTFLHTMAAYYPEKPTTVQQQEMKTMMKTFSKYYPCDDCSYHMIEW